MKTGETHRRQELREDAGRAARRRRSPASLCAVAKPVSGRGCADRGHVSYKLGVLKATPWASPREPPSLGGRGHCHTWPGGALHRGEGRVERRAGFVTMAVGLARSVKGETFLATSCSS